MKYISIILTAIMTSMFFFPFEFTFIPGINTKMMVAALGILIFVWRGVNDQKGVVVTTEILVASLIAAIFSLVCYYAITFNNTNDVAYATYIVSMWVWLVAAYAVCEIIAQVHGYISLKLVVNYLIGVCAVQCLLALLIDNIPSVKSLVDSLVRGLETMNELKRLYGIGASLDVAGTRFAAVLTMIAVLLFHDNVIKSNRKQIAIYVFLFVWIAVVGSMIARTTSIGMIIAFIYMAYSSELLRKHIKRSNLKLWSVMLGIILLLVMVCIILYRNVPAAQKLLYFAFEGLINWMETGEWKTASTDVLQTMWVFPETTKTWLIGDGYFMSPTKPGFYMGTDIGYLRFIFYCGLAGLSVFCVFFIYLSLACYNRFYQERNLFLLLMIAGFVIWVKVSTDIFLVYAIFMCIPMAQKNNQVKRL